MENSELKSVWPTTKKFVLNEDEYENRLWEIIKWDYFPDLEKVEELNRLLLSDTSQSLLWSEWSFKHSDIRRLI
jgi:hypothetical protein